MEVLFSTSMSCIGNMRALKSKPYKGCLSFENCYKQTIIIKIMIIIMIKAIFILML